MKHQRTRKATKRLVLEQLAKRGVKIRAKSRIELLCLHVAELTGDSWEGGIPEMWAILNRFIDNQPRNAGALPEVKPLHYDLFKHMRLTMETRK